MLFFIYIEDTYLVYKCEWYERYVKKYQVKIAKVPFSRLFGNFKRIQMPIFRKRIHLQT